MKNWFRKDELSDFEREIIENVEKNGCHINAVFDPEGKDPSFAYSVGFTKTLEKVGRGKNPEVIMFGLPDEVYGPAINELLAMAAAGQSLNDGTRIDKFFGSYDAVFRTVHPSQITEEYFTSALWYHRTQMGRQLDNVAMIVWPDSNGTFPWESECEEWVKNDQPALYEPRLHS